MDTHGPQEGAPRGRFSAVGGDGGDGGDGAGWARLALLALVASVLVPLVVAGLRSVLWVLVGLAGLALVGVGMWWLLAHTAALRIAGSALCVIAPLTVLALYAASGMLLPVLLSLALWALALGAARATVGTKEVPAARRPMPVEAPHHPWVVMNPHSGGGKVDRFHLADKARAAGARVALLGAEHQDVAEMARQAVNEKADLLAVAGGDGTQALVAEVAAAHHLPFMVIPAGTRNHFALDLGLDREDPAAALEALADGVELRVDLGYAADRVFVNNASFGTYAAVVSDPAYRDDKVHTTLQSLPRLLTGPESPRLRMRAGDTRADGLQALLVSNNPYLRVADPIHPGRRERLDSGLLGVLGVRVDSAVQAAAIARGGRSASLLSLTTEEVVVDADMDADADTVPVGIDGEYVQLPAPVVCSIAPGALRVRVPRNRARTPQSRGAADWPRVTRLALGRPAAGGPRKPSGRKAGPAVAGPSAHGPEERGTSGGRRNKAGTIPSERHPRRATGRPERR